MGDPEGRHQVTPLKADETRERVLGTKAPIVCHGVDKSAHSGRSECSRLNETQDQQNAIALNPITGSKRNDKETYNPH